MKRQLSWVMGFILTAGALLQAAAQEAPPAIEKVEIARNRAFIVNGKPFFPLFAWLQDAKNFPALKECGMNATAGALPKSSGVKNVKEYLELARKAGLYGIMPFEEGLKGHPALLGYIHGDEPDLVRKKGKAGEKNVPQTMPEVVLKDYRAIKAADPTRPVFMTLTAHFMPFFGKEWSAEQRQQLYPAYLKATDVAGFDIYPIYGWNKPEWIYLVHDGTRQLVELAGGRPVYNWIETSRGGQFTGPLEKQHEVTPAQLKAEVWMAVCAGATGIGYFTHIWKPGYKQFGVPEENRTALREVNDQITRLAPAILAQAPERKITLGAAGDVKLTMIAHEHEGEIYVFAVNFDERLIKTKATVYAQGLAKGTEVTAVDEDRKIVAEADGWFKDDFDPLAVHIYRFKSGKR